tara:strand:- start:153 stop:701 length:549 start_codon:yes stop_codon:yes gene_type:complete
MAAKSKWPLEVSEAIWAGLCHGRSLRNITDAINEGDVELGISKPYDIGYNSVKDRARRLKERRGMPRSYIAPGTEETAYNEISRLVLQALKEQAMRLNGRMQRDSGPLTREEIRAANEILTTLEAHEKRRRADEKKRAAASPAAGTLRPKTQRPSDLLDELAARELAESDLERRFQEEERAD